VCTTRRSIRSSARRSATTGTLSGRTTLDEVLAAARLHPRDRVTPRGKGPSIERSGITVGGAGTRQDMELKVYATRGKPCRRFPSGADGSTSTRISGWSRRAGLHRRGGRHPHHAGQAWTTSPWLKREPTPRSARGGHNDYDDTWSRKSLPSSGLFPGASGFLATGCSMGGTTPRTSSSHPSLRCPDRTVRRVQAHPVHRGVHGRNVYFNTPLSYLANLSDPWYLERYRRSRSWCASGRGRGRREWWPTRGRSSDSCVEGDPRVDRFTGARRQSRLAMVGAARCPYFLELLNL